MWDFPLSYSMACAYLSTASADFGKIMFESILMAVPIQVLHNSSGVVYHLDMTRNGFIKLEPQSRKKVGIPFILYACIAERALPRGIFTAALKSVC